MCGVAFRIMHLLLLLSWVTIQQKRVCKIWQLIYQMSAYLKFIYQDLILVTMQKVMITTMLKQNLTNLMHERDLWEKMQTVHSNDEIFYEYCQHNMDRLDEEAERLRIGLEMGCYE